MNSSTPRWMKIVIILFTLPLFSFPYLLGRLPAGDDTARLLVQIYPFYMALSAWLADRAYPQRHHVTWLLFAMMALSTAGVFVLTLS